MNNAQKIMYGYIASYFPERGFGFICDNDEVDEYFFHVSSIDKPFDIVPGKTKVVFTLKENYKGLCAVNIKKYFPRIEGKFGKIILPNLVLNLTNKECYEYLNRQQEKIQTLLDGLKNNGMEIHVAPNGWITLDRSFLGDIEDITPEDGKWEHRVPSGYPDTFEHLFDLLQKQINYFNRTYNTSVKGTQGEEKTSQSLKAISINYPVLHNVLLEEGTEDNRFSAETDTIIITDRAIFLIETKNFGGKGDSVKIAEDGRWEIFDKYQNKTIPIRNNPYKQVTDHIFVIKKFLEKHNVKEDLPIIPIIAIANNDVNIEVENNGLSKILRTDLIGTYVLQYLESHPSVLTRKAMSILNDIFDKEKLPPRTYKVIDYFENIKTVLVSLLELAKYYKADALLQKNIEQERVRKEKEAAEEYRRKQKEEEIIRRQRQSERDKKKAADAKHKEEVKQKEEKKEDSNREKEEITATDVGLGVLFAGVKAVEIMEKTLRFIDWIL